MPPKYHEDPPAGSGSSSFTPPGPHAGIKSFAGDFFNAINNVNVPLPFDQDAYNTIEDRTLSNRQLVGTVPLMEGSGKGIHVPASWANQRGYFNDPENPGQTYFQTNPEFKTFFPNEPDYSALAALNEFEETGGGIYALKPYLEKRYKDEPNFEYNANQHPLGVYVPSTSNIHLNMLMDRDMDHDILNTLRHELKHHWTLNDELVEGPVGTSWREAPLVDQFDTDFNDPLHPEIHMMDMMWDIPDEMHPDFLWFPWDDITTHAQNLGKMHRIGKEEYLGLN